MEELRSEGKMRNGRGRVRSQRELGLVGNSVKARGALSPLMAPRSGVSKDDNLAPRMQH